MVSAMEGGAGGDADEWVETHAGRKNGDNAGDPGEIEDIPDLDDGHSQGAANAMANMSLSDSKAPHPNEIPDMDEIPDMEEDLEGEEDEATAAPSKPPTSKLVEARYDLCRLGEIMILRVNTL